MHRYLTPQPHIMHSTPKQLTPRTFQSQKAHTPVSNLYPTSSCKENLIEPFISTFNGTQVIGFNQ